MSAGSMAMPMNDAPTLPRALLPAILAAGLLALVMLLGHAIKPLLNRPLQALRVDGQLSHLKPQQIAAAAAIAPGARLFDVRLDAVRAQVEALPWVAHARVSRVWPGRIAVRVWERKPYALWGDKGLVDEEGVAFAPPAQDLPQGLPQLAGPAGREAEVMQDYQAIAETLAGGAFAPDGLRLDPRGSWTLHTASGIELRLGEDDPRGKTALLQGAVLRTLDGKLDQVAYIDLRYSNGFAVGWKDTGPCPVLKGAAPGKARPDCGRKDATQAMNAPAMPPAAGAKAAEGNKHE
ncbi:cell division protein FtsQ/DivIB [Nevskia soli]|uniref:cell division protein FtsQ/DivIB n=1 Tax=Nevskia soli TaxID=418856 RepID=UPI0012FBC6C1|nr:cell division protein FtsQ/DivIB [Nevskia soli]